ncbi:MAG: SusC/RagA family TonB-linked outer membrane protein [Tannerella sp.]|jgi:TonB-linked SusC/RagA family outer membrane protein|nr:SusC/RagA family TonB-linked outer membrane protein [Tannerella sp.]
MMKIKKTLLLTLFVLFGANFALAQNQVTGTVTDAATGETLPFVTVMVKGTAIGTATSEQGIFTISVPNAESVLTFTFVGYEMLELRANVSRPMIVRMLLSATMLESVVVTGYQTISRERATGSYVIAGEDVLNKKPSGNISGALTGIIPGLITVSSDLNGQNRFLVRGRGTLRQTQVDQLPEDYQLSMDPLIVVDGMPIQGFTHSTLGGAGFLNTRDPFSTVNPNDVETITVLKDAAATSIYGARAANGVIVITTKKGKGAEKLNIRVDAFTSIGAKPDLDYAFNMASTENTIWYQEHLRTYYPSYQNTWYNPYNYPNEPWAYYINDVARDMLEHYERGNIATLQELRARQAEMIARGDQWKKDLNKYVYRNSVNQQYSISFRGASEKLNYSLSAAYDNNNGYLIGNNNRRFLLNSINNYKLSERLTFNFGFNASLMNSTNNGINFNTLRNSISPWSRLVDENGNFIHIASKDIQFPGGGMIPGGATTVYEPVYRNLYDGKMPANWFYNPVKDRDCMDNTAERLTARLTGGLDYKITDDLKVNVSGQYERNQYSQHSLFRSESYLVRNYNNRFSTFNPATGVYASNFPKGGIFNNRGDLYVGYILRGQVDYSKNFDKHDIAVIAGTEVISSTHSNNPVLWRYGYNENTKAVSTALDYVTQQINMFGTRVNSPYAAPGTLVIHEDRFFSAYANAAYTYNNKYTATASFRTDASNYQSKSMREKFSPFWSVGASWILSREDFMNGIDWVDFLKLRTSFGEAGLAAGKGLTATVTTLGNVNGDVYSNYEPRTQVSVRGNPTLTWEKSRTFDAGVEFRLWKNKLYGNFSYYNKYTYDVLTNASVPIISQGTGTATFNNAVISNKGVELSLGSRMNITKDFAWNGMFNLSFNKNEILKYNVFNTLLRPDYYPGYAMNSIWVYKAVGYTPEGYIILQGKDGTKEKVINRDATHLYDPINGAAGQTLEAYNWIYHLGNSDKTIPTHIGITNTFTYKGFTLSCLLTGKFGYYVASGEIYDTRQDVASFSKALDRAIKVYKTGYDKHPAYAGMPLWTDANKDVFNAGSTWMYYSNLVNNVDQAYIKGNHVRLNEIYLGYDLPNNRLGNFGKYIHSINFFVQARNLGIIWAANNLNIDPDYLLTTSLTAHNPIKPMKTYTFGLKFNIN